MPNNPQKTLLFCISIAECFKNFAAFPGSLFELLEADLAARVFKIVFVIPSEKPALLGHLRSFAERYPDQVAIEYTQLQSRTVAQTVFTFFYSYFVYTGTTKTLATVSMRPSDAPGGGKRWLAPVKWFISRSFGRSRYLRRLVSHIYPLFYPERPFREIFEKYNPSLAIAPDLFDRFDQEFMREVHVRGVRSLGMVMNWDHLDKYFIPFKVDTLTAQSDQMRHFAIEYQGYAPEKIHVVGYPFLDFLVDPKYSVVRENILRDLKFPPNVKYILYIAGSMYAPDEPDIIEAMIQWADRHEFGNHDVYFVIRPYPGGRGRDEEFDEQKFQGFAKHPRVSFQMEKYWAGFETNAAFMNILRHADIVMQVFSTAVIPAAALDRPLLTPTFDGHHVRPFHRSVRRFAMREHFRDVLESGGQQPAENFDELKEKIIAYLDDPTRDNEKRETLRKLVIGPLDGKSSERLHAILLNELRST